MAEEKKSLPMSSAGVIGSTEEAETGLKLKPEQVTGAIIILLVIEIMLPILLG